MNRKLLLAFTFVILLFSNLSRAQYLMGGGKGKDSTLPKAVFGLKAGLNVQSLSGEEWDQSFKPGIVGGIYAGMRKNKVAVCLEVLASTTRYTSKTGFIYDTVTGKTGDFRATYIDLPLLFEYNLFSCVWIQVGPQYSNLMSVKGLNGFGDAKFIFKTGEFSGVLGLEAHFPKNISAGVRYALGLSDMNNAVVSSNAWNTSTFQLFAGYRIK